MESASGSFASAWSRWIGSPREILQPGDHAGFVDDSAVWIAMLQKRNEAVHRYDEGKNREMLAQIRERFIPAFETLARTLQTKLLETGSNWA